MNLSIGVLGAVTFSRLQRRPKLEPRLPASMTMVMMLALSRSAELRTQLVCFVLRHRDAGVWLIVMILLPCDAFAGLGVYSHGNGIKSLGVGGLGFVLAEDSYTLSSNPAGAVAMGERLDLGLDYESPRVRASIRDNARGPDESYSSRAQTFLVPQIGVVVPVSERVSVGATAFFAGLGTDYKRSPFERFGGDPRITLSLAQVGSSFALAYLAAPKQSLGVALNLSYQELSVKGADVFALISEDPNKFSNQGRDGALGVGFTLGWLGEITPQVVGALSYRSKTWAQRFDEYAGLLPEQGRFEFPANFGGGLSWEFVPGWTGALEFQRVFYSSESAIGNPFGQILGGERLGSEDGPGFGWNNQNIYRLGLMHRMSKRWILRAGYIYSTPNIPASQTLFGALAPTFSQRHYTAGATLRLGPRWEVSGYLAHAPAKTLRGRNSIPALVGGGEVDLNVPQYFAGFSFGYSFDD